MRPWRGAFWLSFAIGVQAFAAPVSPPPWDDVATSHGTVTGQRAVGADGPLSAARGRLATCDSERTRVDDGGVALAAMHSRTVAAADTPLALQTENALLRRRIERAEAKLAAAGGLGAPAAARRAGLGLLLGLLGLGAILWGVVMARRRRRRASAAAPPCW
jgi:hypothetical protein